MKNAIQKLASLIINAEKIVVFTGAGISTESGIPDFRSPGGVWERYKPVYYDEFMTSLEGRKRYWIMKKEFYLNMSSAKPNAAHNAVTDLQSIEKLYSLITQNIDGLHQDSGVLDEKIIELHGTNRWIECQTCRKRMSAESILTRLEAGDESPECECGGYLKPATISFGQPMPERETNQASENSRNCDLFIVIGSSLVVYPAASMSEIAVRSGAKLVIVNRDTTQQDSIAELVVNETAGEFLPQVLDEVKKMIENS